MPKRLLTTLLLTLSGLTFGLPKTCAQGSPLPGSTPSLQAPIPGQMPESLKQNRALPYNRLPINDLDARTRLDELRQLLLTSPAPGAPQNLKASIFDLVDWLQDAADAHWRMSQAFAKSEVTRREAMAEKLLNNSFSQLKREALLLKADLLIRENRSPEALNPLVDIVIADPRSSVGKEAYKRLINLGFSKELPAEINTGHK